VFIRQRRAQRWERGKGSDASSSGAFFRRRLTNAVLGMLCSERTEDSSVHGATGNGAHSPRGSPPNSPQRASPQAAQGPGSAPADERPLCSSARSEHDLSAHGGRAATRSAFADMPEPASGDEGLAQLAAAVLRAGCVSFVFLSFLLL